jgi:hypothetical protein
VVASNSPKKRRKRRTPVTKSAAYEVATNNEDSMSNDKDSSSKKRRRRFMSGMFKGKAVNGETPNNHADATSVPSTAETTRRKRSTSQTESASDSSRSNEKVMKDSDEQEGNAPPTQKRRKRRKKATSMEANEANASTNMAATVEIETKSTTSTDEFGGYNLADADDSAKKRKRRKKRPQPVIHHVPAETPGAEADEHDSSSIEVVVEMDSTLDESATKKRKRRKKKSATSIGSNVVFDGSESESTVDDVEPGQLDKEAAAESEVVKSESNVDNVEPQQLVDTKGAAESEVMETEGGQGEQILEKEAEDGIEDTTEIQQVDSDNTSTMDAAATPDDETALLSIDASIEIPSEEVVPESIFSTIEVDGSLAAGGADESEIDSNTKPEDFSIKVEMPERELESDTASSVPEVIVARESPEQKSELTELLTDGMPTKSLQIDATIRISDEEIVPDSVFSTVEVVDTLQADEMKIESLEQVDGDVDMLLECEEPIEEGHGTCKVNSDESQDIVDETKDIEDQDDVENITLNDVVYESFARDDLEVDEEAEDAEDKIIDFDDQLTKEEDADAEPNSSPSVDTVASAVGEEEIAANTEVRVSSVNCDEVVATDMISENMTESCEVVDDAVKESVKHEVNEDANHVDKEGVVLSVVTWNLGEAAPSEKEASFIRKFRQGSDLVMIGAQECEDIKPRRSEGHRSRHLRRLGIQMLGEQYVPIAIHSLGGIQLALYCRREKLGNVEFINIADVTCGVGNVFHNKGAIGVFLKLKHSAESDAVKSSNILLVTGHLAAHVKNVDARNDDFKRIMTELESQAPARFLRPKKNPGVSLEPGDGSHLLNSMDHIIFSGDLNYRVDLPREYVDRCIQDIQSCLESGTTINKKIDGLMSRLLRRDQLLRTISSGRAFTDFAEGKIAFLPTFKFDKGSSEYDTSYKQRIPAWTDRILFKSSNIRVLEYNSVPDAMHSDHRPVYGTFQLGWGRTHTQKERKPKRRSKEKK